MDLLETIGVMPGDLGDFLGTSGYETWTGFELAFDSLEAQACRPYNLGYFEGGATKESGPAFRHREGCP